MKYGRPDTCYNNNNNNNNNSKEGELIKTEVNDGETTEGLTHTTTTLTNQKQRCKYTTSMDIENALEDAAVTHLEPHAIRVQWACSRAENRGSETWNGKPRLECVNGWHPPPKTPAGVLPWTCRSEGKWPSRQTGGKSSPHKWLASRKILSIEELETLPAGTRPRTWHLRSLGGERRGKRKR